MGNKPLTLEDIDNVLKQVPSENDIMLMSLRSKQKLDALRGEVTESANGIPIYISGVGSKEVRW